MGALRSMWALGSVGAPGARGPWERVDPGSAWALGACGPCQRGCPGEHVGPWPAARVTTGPFWRQLAAGASRIGLASNQQPVLAALGRIRSEIRRGSADSSAAGASSVVRTGQWQLGERGQARKSVQWLAQCHRVTTGRLRPVACETRLRARRDGVRDAMACEAIHHRPVVATLGVDGLGVERGNSPPARRGGVSRDRELLLGLMGEFSGVLRA